MANVLGAANRLFIQRKYSQVIALLEPRITLYRGSFKFFYLLGMSSIYLHSWDIAYSYIKSAYFINDRHIPTATSYALLLIRNGQRLEGIQILLDILQNEKNRHKAGYALANRSLEMIKNCGNKTDICSVLDKARAGKYFPAKPINFYPIIGAAIIGFAAITTLLLTINFSAFSTSTMQNQSVKKQGNKYRQTSKLESQTGEQVINVPYQNQSRTDLNKIQIESKESYFDYSTPFEIMLSESEIMASFNEAKEFLQNHQDNFAQKSINQLLLSNCSFRTKQKALVMARMIERPKEMRSFNQSFSFQEVHLFPQLYQNCYVKWQGRISDIVVKSNEITFNFLVGYQDKKVVDGIVACSMEFEAILNQEYPYEILAQIEIDDSYKKEFDKFNQDKIKAPYKLRIVTIRRIV